MDRAGLVAAPPAGAGAASAATVAVVGAGVAVVTSLATSVAFAEAHHPEERLSSAVGTLAGPTYDAVVEGVGAATGRMTAMWSDGATPRTSAARGSAC